MKRMFQEDGIKEGPPNLGASLSVPEYADWKISYYVAACEEFHDLGVFYDNLTIQEAIVHYAEVVENPEYRHMGPGLGMIIQRPDNAEISTVIVSLKKIHGTFFDIYKECIYCPDIRQAMEIVKATFKDYNYVSGIEKNTKYINLCDLAQRIEDCCRETGSYGQQDTVSDREQHIQDIMQMLRSRSVGTLVQYFQVHADIQAVKCILKTLLEISPHVEDTQEPQVVIVWNCSMTDIIIQCVPFHIADMIIADWDKDRLWSGAISYSICCNLNHIQESFEINREHYGKGMGILSELKARSCPIPGEEKQWGRVLNYLCAHKTLSELEADAHRKEESDNAATKLDYVAKARTELNLHPEFPLPPFPEGPGKKDKMVKEKASIHDRLKRNLKIINSAR